MSIATAYFLQCDHETPESFDGMCPEEFGTDNCGYESKQDLVFDAIQHKWKAIGKKQYCPKHAAEHKENS